MNNTALKADLKLVARDPILALFMVIPLFIYIVFRVMVAYLLPIVFKLTGFDLSPYMGYVLAGAFLLTPGMLGTVAGFLMIDEKDAKIFELMSITPAGYSGYISHRLFLPFIAGIIYTFVGYRVLGIYHLNLGTLVYIAFLIGIDGVLIGLLLFQLADDKVKGLTYSKALNILTAVAMADLLKIQWVSALAALTPFYWIVRLINNPEGSFSLLAAAGVHVLWLVCALKACRSN